jgi:general secretion pathway protein F
VKISYEGIDRDGAVISGTLDAVSEREAHRELESLGIAPLELREVKLPQGMRRRRLKQTDVTQALDELCTLLESGVGVGEALDALVLAEYHPQIASFFRHLSRSVQSGETLSRAMREAQLKLPDIVLQLVETGELTGDLARSLRESVDQIQYAETLRAELTSALIYPAILVVSGIGAILLIFAFVVPKFANLVANNDDLPLLASLVINGGLWFNANWLWLLLCSLLIVVVGVRYARSAQGRLRLLGIVARLPLAGSWLMERDVGSWAQSMAAMLGSRVDLLEALMLARSGVMLPARQARLGRVEQAVRAGAPLSQALEENAVLTASAYNLIKVGEKTGRLAEMMRSVATIYETSRRNRTRQLLAVVEPAAILLIGLVIGTLILGVILAITSVNDVTL